MADPRAVVHASLQELSLPGELAALVEVGIYNWAIRFAKQNNLTRSWGEPKFVDTYARKAHSVLLNLATPDGLLLERVLGGDWKPQDVAGLRPQEVRPDVWRDSMQRAASREQRAMNGNIAKSTRFVCKMCNKRETSHYELQTRSGDEPMTIFIKCLNCDYSWRKN